MTIAKLKPFLAYAGIPAICGVLLLIRAGSVDAFTLMKLEALAIAGYIAAAVDLKEKRIPNKLVLAMLAAWIIMMTPKLFFDTDIAIKTLIDAALGLAVGGGLFFLTYLISRKGLGGGDVKFMAAAGIYLGFGRTVSVMLAGTMLAGMTGLTLLLLKKIGRKDTIPLAPFLYIGILITLFFQ